MTDQELLQAIRTITREEIKESEQRMREFTQKAIAENNKELNHSMRIIIENVVEPKFNLLADEISIVREKVESLEKRVERIEDKVLEHDFRLKLIK